MSRNISIATIVFVTSATLISIAWGQIGDPVRYPPYASSQTTGNFPLVEVSTLLKEYQGDPTAMEQHIVESHYPGDPSPGKLARTYFGWRITLVKTQNSTGIFESRAFISWSWQNLWHQIARDGTITSNNGRVIQFRRGPQILLEINDRQIWETIWPVSGCASGPQYVWEREDKKNPERAIRIDNVVFDATDNLTITALPEAFYGCP